MKQIHKIVIAYRCGERDARQNLGNHTSVYKGLEKKAYKNGFLQGQLSRAKQKNH